MRRRGSVTKKTIASAIDTSVTSAVERARVGVMAVCAAARSPAAVASVRSVWTSSVQVTEMVNTTSNGGKNTLSVRFAARITWNSASATSRNSLLRGRTSSS